MSGFGSADVEVVYLEPSSATPTVVPEVKPTALNIGAALSGVIDAVQLGSALANHFAVNPAANLVAHCTVLLTSEMNRREAIFGLAVDEIDRGRLQCTLAIPTPGGFWKCAHYDVTREFIAETRNPMEYLANLLESMAMSPERCYLRSRSALPESMTFWQYGKPWNGVVK